MSVTKNTKAFVQAETQQWLDTDIANGDILDIYGSLGNRAARTLIIETGITDVVVSFNVVQTVYKHHHLVGNRYLVAPIHPSPYGAVETEEARPQITLSANSVYKWENEFAIKDIKVITKSSGMRVLVS